MPPYDNMTYNDQNNNEYIILQYVAVKFVVHLSRPIPRELNAIQSSAWQWYAQTVAASPCYADFCYGRFYAPRET